MATSKLDIEVELKGDRDVKADLKKVGEAAGSVAQKFDSSNSKLGEGITSLSDNVSELGDAFGEVGGAISAVGSTGAKGLLLLVPAIGGVVMAGMALYETFRNITGAAQEAEDAEEAMAAAAADLQSKLEALSEKGVTLTTKELREFTKANLEAQNAKEKLEKHIARNHKVYINLENAQKKVNQATRDHEVALKTSKQGLDRFGKGVKEVASDLARAQRTLEQATHDYHNLLENITKAQRGVSESIKATAKLEKAHEERSLEATLARVKEKHKELEVIYEREAIATSVADAEEETLKRQVKLNSELLAIKIKENDKNVEFLRILEKELDAEIDTFDQRSLLTQQAEKEELKVAKSVREAKLKETKIRQQQQRILERQHLMQAHQLEIARLQFTGASALDILEARYHQQRELAAKNNTLLTTLEYKFETEKTKLIEAEETKRRAEEAKRLEEAKNRELQRREFIISNLEFDADMLEDGTKKELTILELKYRRERELKENSEVELTELSRRYNIERAQIQGRALKEQMQQFKEMSLDVAQSLGTSLTEVFYGSLTDRSFDEARQNLKESFREQVQSEKEALEKFKGDQSERIEETIKTNERLVELQKDYAKERKRIGEEEENALPKAIGEVLVALGQQAAVESLMFGAKAVASLFTNPALAANYGIASGVMAAAAATAGVSGRALGASGGGGGGGTPSISPTGLSQIAPEPERERAETTQTVFNINFGGSVIYDTKQAAERAFADRLTQLQNTRRRGAPRRTF